MNYISDKTPNTVSEWDSRQFFYPEFYDILRYCHSAALQNRIFEWYNGLAVIKRMVNPYFQTINKVTGKKRYEEYNISFNKLKELLNSVDFKELHGKIQVGTKLSEEEQVRYNQTFNIVYSALERFEEAIHEDMKVNNMGLPNRTLRDIGSALLESGETDIE